LERGEWLITRIMEKMEMERREVIFKGQKKEGEGNALDKIKRGFFGIWTTQLNEWITSDNTQKWREGMMVTLL
jgi:hypothetical protein